MVTEPIIGDDEQEASDTGPVRGTGPRARLTLGAGMMLLVVVVVWTGFSIGRLAPSQDDAPLVAPLVTSGFGRIRAPIPAEAHDGHLTWHRVPLTDHRLQAAGEVAGRLVLVLESFDGTSRLGFVSPAGLVAGTAVTSPVDQVASWRNRLLLVGADDDGPVLHLQHADGTVRRLETARFPGGADIGRFTQLVTVRDRLVAVAERTPAWASADLPSGVRELLRETGGTLVARGPELILEAAPGIVVLRRPLPDSEASQAGFSVWVSADGVDWTPVPWSPDAEPSLAVLADGRVLITGGAEARVSTDGRTWADFPTPHGVEGAHGHGRLWSNGPFGIGTIMTSNDGYDWQPVRLSGLAPDPSWTIGSVAAGPAGYAVELAGPPRVTVLVETDREGVTVELHRHYTILRLPDGSILRPGSYRADVDVSSSQVTFSWGSGSVASTGLRELMRAHRQRQTEGLVATSPDGRRWALAPTIGMGPLIPWVSGSTAVIDEGASILVGTPG